MTVSGRRSHYEAVFVFPNPVALAFAVNSTTMASNEQLDAMEAVADDKTSKVCIIL